MQASFLSERSVIILSGEDVIEFLQGLVSSDVPSLSTQNSLYTAMLSPQGKFLHDFFLINWKKMVFIDIASSRAKDLVARLKLYRLRSKVEIELDESLSIAAIWDSKPEQADNSIEIESADYKVYHDPRLPSLGFRAIGRKSELENLFQKNHYEISTEDSYRYFRLSLGVPDTGDMIIDKSLLLEFGFEELHGVNFSKGCYIGQEVTARSKFRGQVRKSIYHITADTHLPNLGSEITLADKSAGEIRTSYGNIGLALIYNDAYEEAQNNKTSFTCNGQIVTIKPIEWLTKNK